MILAGTYKDLSSEDYHEDKESYSRSSIMEFARSPFHYWSKYLNPNAPPQRRKKEWDLGTAFHTMILEPHKFNEQFAPKPAKVLLKDVGRKAYDEYCEVVEELENSNRIIITDYDYLDLLGMKASLQSNEQAMSLIKGTEIEKSFFWYDKESTLKVKARPDIIDYAVYIDLKTVSDASERAYQYEMMRYGYHVQAAMVRDGVREIEAREMKVAINICVEKSYPYAVAIYFIDEAAIDEGERFYKQKLMEIKSAIVHNKWCGYDTKLIGLPAWYQNQK